MCHGFFVDARERSRPYHYYDALSTEARLGSLHRGSGRETPPEEALVPDGATRSLPEGTPQTEK